MFFAQQFVIIISRHSNAVLATLQLVPLFERRAIIISLQQQSCCCCNSTQLGSSGVVRSVPLIHLMWWFVVLLVLLQWIKKLYRDSFNISLFFEFKGPLSRDFLPPGSYPISTHQRDRITACTCSQLLEIWSLKISLPKIIIFTKRSKLLRCVFLQICNSRQKYTSIL